jgi:hypothetical protein
VPDAPNAAGVGGTRLSLRPLLVTISQRFDARLTAAPQPSERRTTAGAVR